MMEPIEESNKIKEAVEDLRSALEKVGEPAIHRGYDGYDHSDEQIWSALGEPSRIPTQYRIGFGETGKGKDSLFQANPQKASLMVGPSYLVLAFRGTEKRFRIGSLTLVSGIREARTDIPLFRSSTSTNHPSPAHGLSVSTPVHPCRRRDQSVAFRAWVGNMKACALASHCRIDR